MEDMLRGLLELSKKDPATLALVLAIALAVVIGGGMILGIKFVGYLSQRDDKAHTLTAAEQQAEIDQRKTEALIEQRRIDVEERNRIAQDTQTQTFIKLTETLVQHSARALDQQERLAKIMETQANASNEQSKTLQELLTALQAAAASITTSNTGLQDIGQKQIAMMNAIDKTHDAVNKQTEHTEEARAEMNKQLEQLRREVVEKFAEVSAKIEGLGTTLTDANMGQLRTDMKEIQDGIKEAVGGIGRIVELMQPPPAAAPQSPAVAPPSNETQDEKRIE